MHFNDEELSWKNKHVLCSQFILRYQRWSWWSFYKNKKFFKKVSRGSGSSTGKGLVINIQGPYMASYLGPVSQTQCLYCHTCANTVQVSLRILYWVSHDTALKEHRGLRVLHKGPIHQMFWAWTHNLLIKLISLRFSHPVHCPKHPSLLDMGHVCASGWPLVCVAKPNTASTPQGGLLHNPGPWERPWTHDPWSPKDL